MKTYCKYYKQKEQISYNDGVSWSDTGNYRKGGLYEYDSEICTYNPVEVYSGQPFTFEAIDNCTFGVTIRDNDTNSRCSVLYSLDSGSTWDSLYSTGSSVSVAAGNKIYFKSFWGQYWHSGIFVTTGRFNVEGNIMSLPWGDDFIKGPFYVPEMKKTLKKTSGHIEYYYEFREMLKGCTGLISARNLLLPATQDFGLYPQWVYTSMFSGCTSLTMPPIELPAPTVPANGYQEMFKDCCSLIETPEILATKAYDEAFESMFENCTSLSKVMQSLYADSVYLQKDAYNSMFKYCINIKNTPDLARDVLWNGEYVFNCCISLSSVTLPYNTTIINNGAFSGCTSLTGITINNPTPPSLGINVFENTNDCPIFVPCETVELYKRIDDWRFFANRIQSISGTCEFNGKYFASYSGGITLSAECDSTSAITLNNSSKSNLIFVKIGNCVKTISDRAFYNCRNLIGIGDNGSGRLVEIPNSVTTIGNYAFDYCGNLRNSLIILNSVTSIGENAFEYCSGLTDVTIGSGITSISNYTFSMCNSISSITIPNTVISIGDGAFQSCSGLSGITIPNSVTTIGEYTFNGCHSLSSVTIPNSVTSIGNGAFAYCIGASSINIPSGVTTIGANTFIGCTGLTSITIPSGITSIGQSAFEDCRSLTSIDIPDRVTNIGNYAFKVCSGLINCTVGSGVTNIGYGAFSGCTNLTSINIPDGVTNISNSAFTHCTGLQSVTVNRTTPPTLGTNVFTDTNNCIIYVPCNSVDAYKAASGWSTYASRIQAIPGSCPFTGKWLATYSGGTTSSAECDASSAITKNEFTLTDLISVEIGQCVTSIGGQSFEYCGSLTSCTIGSGVTSIGNWAFESCSSLTSIDIPNSVTSIGDAAFYTCSGLTKVTIPSNVTSIGDSAFRNCTSLTSITVEATTPPTLGWYVFNDTNDCPIYVPTESVETYKSASRWSAYASRIQAIP